jgi:hypothetical protein
MPVFIKNHKIYVNEALTSSTKELEGHWAVDKLMGSRYAHAPPGVLSGISNSDEIY